MGKLEAIKRYFWLIFDSLADSVYINISPSSIVKFDKNLAKPDRSPSNYLQA